MFKSESADLSQPLVQRPFGSVEHQGLKDLVLIAPRLHCPDATAVKIISGYASSTMAADHILTLQAREKAFHRDFPTDIDLVYGMAGVDGVNEVNHSGFVSLQQKKEFGFNGSFSCSYVPKPTSVHSKVYVWCTASGVPTKAFCGSVNYSENGFTNAQRTETVAECDPVTALDFFNLIKKRSIACQVANREKDFSAKRKSVEQPRDGTGIITVETNGPFAGCLKLPVALISRRRGVGLGNGSNLNWGKWKVGPRRSGKSVREPNQAYIAIPMAVQKTDFFPPKKVRFSVLTDDGVTLTCVREQEKFGKAITTPQDNSEIGRYFRNRLGVPLGQYLEVDDLRRYGRDNVVFYKLDDGQYFMDFHV